MSEHKVEFTTTKAYLGKGATGMEFTVFCGDDNSTKKNGHSARFQRGGLLDWAL